MSGLVVFNQWEPVVSCCGGAQMLMPVSEVVPVTAPNTFARLTNAPVVTNPITLMVNGRGFFPIGSSPSFSVSGDAITWLSAIYSVQPSDEVVAVYYYLVG